MKFEEWAREYSDDLQPDCGRYEDMRDAWNAALEKWRWDWKTFFITIGCILFFLIAATVMVSL